jgi:hypothetical protein
MNKKPTIKLNIDTSKLAAALSRSFISIDTIINSPEYQKIKAQAKEVSKQKRWATDPLDLMPYFNRFKFSKLRQSLSFFLYDLARWVDPDFLD